MNNIIEQAKAQSKIAECMTPIRNLLERNIALSKERGYDDYGLQSLFYTALFSAEIILNNNGSTEDCELWIRDFGYLAR